MDKESFYAYAIGEKGKGSYKINYNPNSIYVFKSKEEAQKHMEKTLQNTNLEGIIIDITNLIQKGYISKERLKIID
jgi:hypothetical protein